MTIPDIIIAIDGHSSTGKSTFAKLIARSFGFKYLDSGAYYRAVTLHCLETGVISGPDGIDKPAVIKALEGLEISTGQDSHILIGSRNVSGLIRSLEVSDSVSPVAAIAEVRSYVDERLHKASEAGRVVMDGRDIGTTVFPHAELKIFMTADENVRARRRYDEMVSKGETPDFEDVLNNIKERDRIDSSRETSPLRQAPDAFVLDNSEMSLEDEMIWIQGLIMGKFAIYDGRN